MFGLLNRIAAFFASLGYFAGPPADYVRHSRPSVNIDGSPMVGDVDINGNPYGITGSLGGGLDVDPSQPVVNIDGTPMLGSLDLHGRPYGITDSWSSHDSWGSHDSWSSHDSGGCGFGGCGRDW